MQNINQEKELKKFFDDYLLDKKVALKFIKRLMKGRLTRDENPESHFSTYFAAYDLSARQIFIGLHKKAGLWLFNGGHIDKGELIRQTLTREINEEWGIDSNDLEIKSPAFLTITEIDNPSKQSCRIHYDLWHFISVDKNYFNPEKEKLLQEFHEAGWKSLKEAKDLIRDRNTLKAIDFIEKNYFV